MKKGYGILILRVGLGIVFLYFSLNQIFEPLRWVDLIPSFFSKVIDPVILIYLNGFFDFIIGTFLFLGKFLRIVSIFGFLHLLGISLFSLGFTPSGIRDFGLAMSLLSLFFLSENSNSNSSNN
jgi:uncharacterized membrane protein YphA (DoxX/SURF4 family)